jgi:hypothetical protein
VLTPSQIAQTYPIHPSIATTLLAALYDVESRRFQYVGEPISFLCRIKIRNTTRKVTASGANSAAIQTCGRADKVFVRLILHDVNEGLFPDAHLRQAVLRGELRLSSPYQSRKASWYLQDWKVTFFLVHFLRIGASCFSWHHRNTRNEAECDEFIGHDLKISNYRVDCLDAKVPVFF